MYRLVSRAREQRKRIVLPEGTEPRTVKAAVECVERGIAGCLLLGSPAEVRRGAEAQGVQLPEGLEGTDPEGVRVEDAAARGERRRRRGVAERGGRRRRQAGGAA